MEGAPDPERDAKLDRTEEVQEGFPDRVFAFDELGPLGIRPTAGPCWPKQGNERARIRSEKGNRWEADRFQQQLDHTGTSNMSSRPSSSSHCSPTSTKPNPEIVARDAVLSGLIVTRTVLTRASATARRTSAVSIALA